ncbi:MAG: CDP-alcohol phosphatidyltransferase family protein [Alphaproteobacteria bacterium GM7ARS4]|nr:CDP-alcohol phosphatidyltransferase family protein [Alphaproteobacteria bacterium GM7ARS4]
MTTKLTRLFTQRYLEKPLRGKVTPNTITTWRLITGVIACALFAYGTRLFDIIAGIVWTLGCFLDRVDGTLARQWNMTSHYGHVYDYMSDAVATVLFFVAIGYAATDVPQPSFIPDSLYALSPFSMGLIAGVSVAAAFLFSQWTNPLLPGDAKAWQGDGPMDLDDIPYFFGIVAWLDCLDVLLLSAYIGAPVFAVIAAVRWFILSRIASRQP